MMKKAVIVVSFGTAVERARQEEIEAVEHYLRQQVPNCPMVSAYTSPTIRKILAKRGIQIPSLEEAMEKLAEQRVQFLYVLPTHLLPGYEYDKIQESLMDYGHRFEQIVYAQPLMANTQQVQQLAQVLIEHIPRREGEMTVLLGHGSEHQGNLVYPALQGVLHLAGRTDLLVGTVEGYPDFEAVFSVLQREQPKQITLLPLMLVAGTPAIEDMAGEQKDSWKSQLEQAGFAVKAVFQGLGALPEIQQLYADRLQHLMDSEYDI